MKYLVACASVFFAVACTQWTVIKSVEPNPYAAGGCKVAVKPLSYEGVRVGSITEAEWLGKKPPEETASYNADKVTMAQNFQTQFVAGTAPHASAGETGAFIVTPKLTMWEPGFFTAFINKPSECSLDFVVTDDKGTVLDEIATTAQVPASIYNPSTGGRMHSCGKQLGQIAAKYMSSRLTCGK
jgi:hypothetical protein